jgi:predicted  nucleic acid-binding Zn-ribbon protein
MHVSFIEDMKEQLEIEIAEMQDKVLAANGRLETLQSFDQQLSDAIEEAKFNIEEAKRDIAMDMAFHLVAVNGLQSVYDEYQMELSDLILDAMDDD